MKHYTKASPNGAETPRELENRRIAYEAACEGMVLLKNDGTLPLKNKKVALYGPGAARTIKGGTGSGDEQEVARRLVKREALAANDQEGAEQGGTQRAAKDDDFGARQVDGGSHDAVRSEEQQRAEVFLVIAIHESNVHLCYHFV
jgi:beta-glucosidase-like glycosyl hydrolase